jgi:hypothetical protein
MTGADWMHITIGMGATGSWSYSIGRELEQALPEHEVTLPPPFGELEAVVPQFQTADVVIIVWSTADPLWSAFQLGLAHGLGKRVLNIAYDRDSAEVATMARAKARLAGSEYDVGRAVRSVTEADPPPPLRPNQKILLFPTGSAADLELRDQLQRQLTGRRIRPVQRPSSTVCADVLWLITPYELNLHTGEWSNLKANVRTAQEAGRNYGGTVAAGQAPALSIARLGSGPPTPSLEHLVVARAEDHSGLMDALTEHSRSDVPRLVALELINIKCFDRIRVPLSTDSSLGGAWTCVAGINGSGKSTILQSISLALLGRRRCVELGISRLGRMLRRTSGVSLTRTEIQLTVQVGSERDVLSLPLGPSGPDDRRLQRMSTLPKMEKIWEQLSTTLIVGYGATRNLSDTPYTPQDRSPMAQRQLTLFDPLAQIASSEALTLGGPRFAPALLTLARMLSAVLSEPGRPFECSVDPDGRLRFARDGAELDALDLPDGFRSIVALLADIAHGWHDLHPNQPAPEPASINGIVLVDELDLHLHVQLQREIVSRLRSALPRVQWIITTHSPLIMTSFESSELVVLDREAEGGIRELDREVVAFSANEVYDWLLDTPPISRAGEEELAADPGSELLYQSPATNSAQAKQIAANQGDLLAKLSSTRP